MSSSRTACTGVPPARVNAYSTRKRVEKARPSRWNAKAWLSKERPTRAMVESPRPATKTTVPTNGIGPLAASRPIRWYSAGRLNRSVRVCSVVGTTPAPGGRCPPQAAMATRSQAGARRQCEAEIVMRESRKRLADAMETPGRGQRRTRRLLGAPARQ